MYFDGNGLGQGRKMNIQVDDDTEAPSIIAFLDVQGQEPESSPVTVDILERVVPLPFCCVFVHRFFHFEGRSCFQHFYCCLEHNHDHTERNNLMDTDRCSCNHHACRALASQPVPLTPS